jgi:hypothetical protein
MPFEKPNPITTDYRGTKIEPGKIVAYNLSGYVRLGEIVQIQRNDVVETRGGGWWNHKFELLVRNIETQKISKVKNPGSFVIIGSI